MGRPDVRGQMTSGLRLPRLVVAGGLGSAALRKSRPGRPMGGGRAGEVGPVRLPPAARCHLFRGRQFVDRMMQPAMPCRRHAGGFDDAAIDHPAPLETQHRIDLAALGAVVAVAELVLAHKRAIARGPQLRAEGLTVPPGEEAQDKGLPPPSPNPYPSTIPTP